MFVLVSNELITKLGMYVLLPIFIAFLFFIMCTCKLTRAGVSQHKSEVARAPSSQLRDHQLLQAGRRV